ncbi:MAG TPA: hypothetical protein VNU49_02620 [Opitutaceae bacterium]|jgi:hypothetical protein|nr:hypothetical protein [Opitutaceae bacterium]
MRHRLFILWWIALLGLMPAVRGQSAPTPPVDVPAESDLAQNQDNLDLKQSLDLRHADLAQRFQAWNEQAQAYNSQYASRDLDPNSSEYAAGQAMLSRLSSDLSSYNADNAAFAADVARLVPKPPAPVNSPPPIKPSNQSLVGPDGIDSRALITSDDYQDALKKEQDLLKRQQRWQDELAKLKGWQQGLESDRSEFDKIQREAQIDALHDVLLKIPAGETFEKFSDWGYLTKDQAGTLTAGYDALKGLVNGAEGLSAENNQEQLEKILEARKDFHDTMTDQVMMKLKETNPAAFKWYDGIGKAFDAAQEGIVFAQQSNHSPEAWGQFAVKVGVAIVPVANYVIIADTVIEKGATQHIVQAPLNSLNEALSKNFDAQRYLQQKLDPVNRDLAGVQETITNYEAIHPKNGQ